MTDFAESDPYSTHQVPLIAAVMQTEGPVVEFGLGHYSTPILHELCRDRYVLSLDASPDWVRNFDHLASDTHNFAVSPDHDWTIFDALVDQVPQWSVVLIDHGDDVSLRSRDIVRLKDRATFIVVHDSNVGAYGFDKVTPLFKYVWEYTPYVLHTLVLSNVRPFSLQTPIGAKVR